MEKFDVIIIGSGPSGLMTALNINKKKVLLLEANNSLGGKIKVSGGGRCNVTNKKDIDSFLENVPKNNKFLYSTLNNLSPKQLIDFFENKNISLKEEDNNRIFPVTNKSQTIIDFFLDAFQKKKNIDYKLNYLVTKINKEQNGYIINDDYLCKYLVFATGGVTYPYLSQGDIGHKLLGNLSHNIAKLLPTESPLTSNDEIIQTKELQGITLKNSSLEVYIENKKKYTFKKNNILITHFGLSGPNALKASYYIKEAIEAGKNCFVRIIPNSQEVPKKISKYLNDNSYLDFNIIDIKGFNTAFLTNGGIKINEINSQTFESKINKNLFIIGEVIDVHAYTGGYNIAICFSEGYTCGNYINSL